MDLAAYVEENDFFYPPDPEKNQQLSGVIFLPMLGYASG